MESNLNEFEEELPLRPTLLTVLCILTFIGSALTLIKNAYTYSTAAQSVRIFSSAAMKRQGDSTLQKDLEMKNSRNNRSLFGEKMLVSLSKVMTEDNIRKNAISEIISGICTLLGGVLMWRLRRSGFYLYIAGILAGLIVPFFIYENNFLAVGLSSFSSLFGLVFIALYALNIKSMR